MKEIPLGGKRGQGKVALVDDADYELLSAYRWHLDTGDYPSTNVPQGDRSWTKVRLHRLLSADPQGGRFLDHINGDRLDNQRSNLRPATREQNARNRTSHKNNKSGYKGVSKKRNGYRATINLGKEQIHLGQYKTPELAAAAYNGAARVLYASWARPNIILEIGHAAD